MIIEERSDGFAFFIRRVRPGNILVWALILTILICLALGLVESVPNLLFTSILALASLNAGCGWIIGRSKLPGFWAVTVMLLLGLSVPVTWTGQLGGPLVRLLRTLNEIAAAGIRWFPLQPFPDGRKAWMMLVEISQRAIILLDRWAGWLAGLVQRSPGVDPAAALLTWGALVAIVTLWLGFTLARLRRPLLASLPTIALLGVILAFARAKPGYLVPLLAAVLLLMALKSHQEQEKRWIWRGIDYSEDIRLELGMAALVLALGVAALASLSPNLTLSRLNEFINRFRPPTADTSTIEKSLGLERQPEAQPQASMLVQRQQGGLPREHLLGAGPDLSQHLFMTVTTGDYPPGPPQSVITGPVPQYYWRSLTYDRYTGFGWNSSPTYQQSIPAGTPFFGEVIPTSQGLRVPLGPGQRLVRQEVRLQGDEFDQSGLLYAAGSLFSTDQDVETAWRALPQPPAEPGDLFGANLSANAYVATSIWNSPGEEQLRKADGPVPDEITARYLSLPQDLPARVRSLSLELTATEPTAYDRALAIQDYLRAYPYSLDIPTPPINRDVVDYFLFDLKTGYCDYYASAMVVLARAAGLPARLTMGFASGAYDSALGQYLVTEADAHSWPEIYFPGYGWIIFEPTANRPIFDRSEAEQPEAIPSQASDILPPRASPSTVLRLIGGAALIAAALLLLAGLWVWSEPWRLSRTLPQEAIAEIYRRLYTTGKKLKPQVYPGDTPAEFAGSLILQMQALSEIGGAGSEASQIADYYSQAVYSPYSPDGSNRDHAIQLWTRLRSRLWRIRLEQWVQRLRERWNRPAGR